MKQIALFGISYRVSQILAQGLLVLTSPFFLSESALGYFYTMISLASAQALFELGLGQVILVFFSRLGSISNSNSAKGDSDISLLYRTATVLYSIIALCFFLIGGLLGYLLLDSSGILERQVWLPPWLLLCLITSLNIINNKNLLYVESTGREKSVFSIRSLQFLCGSILYLFCAICNLDLWSVFGVPLGCLLVSSIWLKSKGIKLLFGFKNSYITLSSVFTFWKKKVFPLQLKTSISFLSGFVGIQLFLPLVFKFYGPVAAGQVGFSLNIMTGITLLSTSFSTANVRRFASYAKNNENKMILRLFKQSLLFTIILSLFSLIITAILLLQIPHLASLVPNIWIFFILALGCLSNSITYCYAIYLRSYLKEPLVLPSVIAALISLLLFLFVNSGSLLIFVASYAFGCTVAFVISSFVLYSFNNKLFAR